MSFEGVSHPGVKSDGDLSVFEAEKYIEALRPFSLKEVGTPEWFRQHERISELNIQAHHCALAQKEEFVVESLVSQDKVTLLIHELLVIDAWKTKVYPFLTTEAKEAYAKRGSFRPYVLLYHEAVLCNLLEIVLFHAHAAESIGEVVLEVGDYVYRKIIRFLGIEDPKEMHDESLKSEDALDRQDYEIFEKCFLCSLTMLRFLTDHVAVLPLGIVNSLVEKNDVLHALVALLETPPWEYLSPDASKIKGDDVNRLCKEEAQLWLTINNLIVDSRFRPAHTHGGALTDHRRDTIMRIRRHINEPLVDQIPVLIDLQRAMEEMMLMGSAPQGILPSAPGAYNPMEGQTSDTSFFRIEEIPQLWDGLMHEDFKKIAEHQRSEIFNESEEERRQAVENMARVFAGAGFEDVLDDPKCGECGKPAKSRCSRCKSEWYCSRECQVKAWKKHKPLCDLIVAAVPSKN